MSFVVRPATPSDVAAIAAVLGDALRTSPWLRARFPHTSTQDHLDFEKARQLANLQDPAFKALVAVKEHGESEIVGVVTYEVVDAPPDEGEQQSPGKPLLGMQEEFGLGAHAAKQEVVKRAFETEGRHLKGICMGVLERVQRHGVAFMLADKVREEAAKLNLKLYMDCIDGNLGFFQRYAAKHDLDLTSPREPFVNPNRFGEPARENFLKFERRPSKA